MRGIWITALLAASVRAADVTVFLTGDAIVPNAVSYPARCEVTRMFAGMGIRLVWDAKAPARSPCSSSFTVSAKFITGMAQSYHQGAVAYVQPFNDDPVITVMYDRVQKVVFGRPRLVRELLAHVLAHEIGHVLLGTDAHAPTGMMKAHWTEADFDEMEKKPLRFALSDEEIIRARLHLADPR